MSFFKIGYTPARGCLCFVCLRESYEDPDLGVTLAIEGELIVFNPKSTPVSNKVTYVYTFEEAPPDFLYLNDYSHAVVEFVDPNNVNIKDVGTVKQFEASNYSTLIAALKALLPDPQLLNNRHLNNLELQKAIIEKYCFSTTFDNVLYEQIIAARMLLGGK